MPVVLCYLEGQTYEEAARRIGCPVGTVRVRLSRARDRLRDRLTRRGFGTAGIAAVQGLADATAPARLPASGPAAAWVEATVKGALAYAAGSATAAGVVPALALALGDEMLRGLAMSQWKFVMIVLMALGTTSAAAWGLAGGGGQDAQVPQGARAPTQVAPAPPPKPQAPPAKPQAPPALKELPEPVEVMIPKQRERILNAAAQRLDAQRAYYEEGRITIDRFIQALQLYYEAQKAQAQTREERIRAAQRYWELTGEVHKREEAELKVGRGTAADLAEAQLARELAAMEWVKAHKEPGPGEVEALQKRVEALEKQLDRVLKQLERTGGANR
jgi:hypothetical protein